jgi:hypothetical protein
MEEALTSNYTRNRKRNLTDPPPKEDTLDLRMFLVSLKSCIACLVVLSSSPSLLCSPANNRENKILEYTRICYRRTVAIKWNITRLGIYISPKNRTSRTQESGLQVVVNKLTGTESLMI